MPSAPEPPKAPDPVKTAQAQTESNKATLHATQAAQNINQQTPYGSLNYAITGYDPEGNPLYTATSQLSPDQQKILDQLEQYQTGAGGIAGNLLNNVAGMYGQAPDFSEAAGTQVQKNMERQLGYLTPFFTQQTEQLDNQLRNQGLTPGTQAYDRALRTLQNNQNQSVMSFLNQTQPIAFQQAQAQYNQPMQTLQNLFGMMSPQSLVSNFARTPGAQMNPTDVAGIYNAAYGQQMQNYQAQLGQHNNMMSGIFGLATLPFLL